MLVTLLRGVTKFVDKRHNAEHCDEGCDII